jgi:hypothetical protein
MIDRTDSGFSKLCVDATTVAFFYGNKELAVRFATCPDDVSFKRLCWNLEGYKGDNPVGDTLLKALQEIRLLENISERLIKDLDKDEMI